MAKAIERIERDILALEEAIQAIAKELQTAYTNYLTALGQTVRKQLILATYHLCTQGYPESFLNLSLHQRQQLQQAIRKLGQQTAEQLQGLINRSEQQVAEEDEEDE
jgi:geranylgeranyl pyrophosphate synthase